MLQNPPPIARLWLTVYLFLHLGATLVAAESSGSRHTCTADVCVEGTSAAGEVGARILRPEIHLYPGTYTSSSSPHLVDLLPRTKFLSPGTISSNSTTDDKDGDNKPDGIPFSNTIIQPFKGSLVNLFSKGDYSTGEWTIVVQRRGGDIQWYQKPGYQHLLHSVPLNQLTLINDGNSSTGPTKTHFNTTLYANISTDVDGWESLLLPPETYIKFSASASHPSSSSSPDGGLLVRGSIPNRRALSRDVQGHGWKLGFDAQEWLVGSDACNPTCSPIGGTCLVSAPPNTTTTSTAIIYTCHCTTGFTGPTCSACAKGFFGPSCKPCAGQCFDPLLGGEGRCDDGVQGSGGCAGVVGNSTASCNCLHGTCTSSNTCTCSAGWVTPLNTSPAASSSTATQRCSVCGEGWYLDIREGGTGDCLACSLGTTACSSATQATQCVPGWSVDAMGSCVPAGNAASCVDGQYWDSEAGRCGSCSPACQTCTGPTSNDCLRCTSPRANLLGSCVPYDVLTGVCDSSGVRMEGMTILDSAKGRCDACPRGCSACAIPGFSVTSTRQDLKCTACQEGWMMQDGSCVETCGKGWFLPIASPSINGTCQPCDSKQCSDCISSSAQCTICADTGKYATPAGNCVSSCPDGTYASESDKRCISCPADCETCLASGHCLRCSKSAPVMNWATLKCTAECFPSTYWQASSSSCAPCAVNCTSCTGPSDGQCLSCAVGSVLKGGSCGNGVCDVVPQLGICMRDDNDNGNTWWPWVLSVLLTLSIFGGIVWWVWRSRRQRRQATAAFAATLDDSEIDKKMAGLSGIFQILNPYKVHGRSPSREAFLPPQKAWTTYREPRLSEDNTSTDASPPYASSYPPPYQPSVRFTDIDLKEPVVPAPLKEGPLRAAFVERPDIEDSVKAFDRGRRPFTNRVDSREGDIKGSQEQDINEWLRDDDVGANIPLRDRNPFKIV